MMGRKAVTEHTPQVHIFIVLTDQKITDCSDKINDRKVKAESEFVPSFIIIQCSSFTFLYGINMLKICSTNINFNKNYHLVFMYS